MNDDHRGTIASRLLHWVAGGSIRDVTVSIFAPASDDGTFRCDFAIDGLPEPVRDSAHGVDSLQAMILAVVAVRHHLDAHRDDIAFIAEPRQHGIPLIVPPVDVDEDRYVERIVFAEIDHFLEVSGRAHARYASRLGESFGLVPFDAPHEVTTGTLLAMLADLSAQSNSGVAPDEEREFAFEERRHAILAELHKRPGHETLLGDPGNTSPRADADR